MCFAVAIRILQIPQTNQTRANGELTDQEKATRSSSAYIERSSHFFALCPSVKDRDEKKDVEYDYGSWLASGDCRMELFALFLARNNSVPAIVSVA